MRIVPDDFECSVEVRERFEEQFKQVAPLIRKKAIQLSKQINENVDDVEQWYKMVLMRSMASYDPSKGVKFSTYFYQALTNVTAMIIGYNRALKRNPHHKIDGERKSKILPGGLIMSVDSVESPQNPIDIDQGEAWGVEDDPENRALAIERSRAARRFRLTIFQRLSKPIDRKILGVLLNPPKALFNLINEGARRSKIVVHIAETLGATPGQIKAASKRIDAAASDLMKQPYNISIWEQNQSWIGLILHGGIDMSENEAAEVGCLGFYAEGDLECNGNPEGATKEEKDACTRLKKCRPINQAARIVAEAEGAQVEDTVRAATKSEDNITELLTKAVALKKAAKEKAKKKPKKSKTKVEKEPEPSPPAEEPAETEPTPSAEEPTETEPTEEPKPKGRQSGLLDLNHPCRLFAHKIFDGIAGLLGVEIKLEAEATTEGDLYVRDKTPMGGGGCNYLSLYSHREVGKDQGIIIAYLKTRTGTLDVGVVCPDGDTLRKVWTEIVPGTGAAAIRNTPEDGHFKGRLMGIPETAADSVIETVKILREAGKVNL